MASIFSGTLKDIIYDKGKCTLVYTQLGVAGVFKIPLRPEEIEQLQKVTDPFLILPVPISKQNIKVSGTRNDKMGIVLLNVHGKPIGDRTQVYAKAKKPKGRNAQSPSCNLLTKSASPS